MEEFDNKFMCMVSNVGDGWAEKFPDKWPKFDPPPAITSPFVLPSGVSQSDFDALKKEVQELKELLKAAKKFDQETGQPDCEMDEKVKLIKAIAKLVGVDLGEIFGHKPSSPNS